MKARVALKIRPGARRTAFIGAYGAGWKLSVAAPPVDGRANEEIIRYFAEILSVRRAAVRIVSGATSSNKIIEVDGLSPETVHRAILEAHGSDRDTGNSAPGEA